MRVLHAVQHQQQRPAGDFLEQERQFVLAQRLAGPHLGHDALVRRALHHPVELRSSLCGDPDTRGPRELLDARDACILPAGLQPQALDALGAPREQRADRVQAVEPLEGRHQCFRPRFARFAARRG